MTPIEVKAEIEKVTDRDFAKELTPLLERLRCVDSTATFRALFPSAAHSQDNGLAAPAAWLLRRVNPKCPISCREAVSEMLTDWDVSIEEVPFYLAEQFGVSAVRAVIMELRASSSVQDRVALLDAIEYWLNCFDEMQDYKRKRGAAPDPNSFPAVNEN